MMKDENCEDHFKVALEKKAKTISEELSDIQTKGVPIKGRGQNQLQEKLLLRSF